MCYILRRADSVSCQSFGTIGLRWLLKHRPRNCWVSLRINCCWPGSHDRSLFCAFALQFISV